MKCISETESCSAQWKRVKGGGAGGAETFVRMNFQPLEKWWLGAGCSGGQRVLPAVFHEPPKSPPGLGVRQSSAALARRPTPQSGRGLPQSKTLSRRTEGFGGRCAISASWRHPLNRPSVKPTSQSARPVEYLAGRRHHRQRALHHRAAGAVRIPASRASSAARLRC